MNYETSWIKFVEQKYDYNDLQAVLKIEVTYVFFRNRITISQGLFTCPFTAITIAEQLSKHKDAVKVELSVEEIDWDTEDYEVELID